MDKDLIFINYKKSLEQKYNAVCFDIDGTLTKKNSKIIDDRAIEIIIGLLKRKIPVVFITGRGQTGLENLKVDIYEKIANNGSITDSDLKRIYVLTNDGARLFYSEKVSKEEFLKENIYISTEKELNQLLSINQIICDMKSNLSYGEYFDIKYSRDLKTNMIINIRLVFNCDDNEISNYVFDYILKYIESSAFSGLHLTRGIYMGNNVIQIGTATKDQAIERTEKLIGVPQNSMIRIGDCGDSRGNDYSMLNCNQGYSVDKISGSCDSCFPVFDDDGNILKGVDATLHLIKRAKILPTVCLEKANKFDYIRAFAYAEKQICFGRQRLLSIYNKLINNNFNVCDGIDSLFDKYSGSVIIPMYEWELIVNSPLKDLWSTIKNNKQIYSIRDDNNYLLRGSSTYYYFISRRESNNGIDIASRDNVIEWYENYMEFLDDSIKAILITNNLNDCSNKKLLLGILDNCRNVLLVLLNHYLVNEHYDQNVLLNISSKSEKIIYRIYDNLIAIEKIMANLCFLSGYILDNSYITECVNETKEILKYSYGEELANNEIKYNYSKDYRAYREIDNFGENYVAVSLYNEKCDSYEIINACGLSYGGIELPILAKIINQNRIDKILLLRFNREVSGYTNKQLIELRSFNIRKYGGLINANLFNDSKIDLFDDNILTGKTLQLSINSLYDYNIGVNNVCVVRYPSINRIDQMFLKNSSAVDYSLFFNYIYGLCFSSPYSWKDNNWKKVIGEIDYTDSLGVFDLNRKKIVECLIKNHDYNEKSEVGEYRRRLVK